MSAYADQQRLGAHASRLLPPLYLLLPLLLLLLPPLHLLWSSAVLLCGLCEKVRYMHPVPSGNVNTTVGGGLPETAVCMLKACVKALRRRGKKAAPARNQHTCFSLGHTQLSERAREQGHERLGETSCACACVRMCVYAVLPS